MGTAVTDDPGRAGLDGFLALYRQALPQVYRYLYRGCAGITEVAEDLTQETFLAAVAQVRAGRAASVTLPWLLVVARNKLVDHHRRRGREQRSLTLAWKAPEAGDGADGWTVRSRGQALELLQGLPADQRLALALRYVDDLSVAEVAKAIGRSMHATESLLARARRQVERRAREADRG